MSADKSLCAHAFDVLIAKTSNTAPPPTLPGGTVGGVFVTWKQLSRGEWDLRGCIGTLSPTELGGGVKSYAYTAAFEDPRFDAIRGSEVSSLSVHVSVLDNFVDAPGLHEWRIGEHGLVLEFSARGRRYSGTYLPEISKEQGWDQRTTIEHLIEKTGFEGRRADIDGDISLKTYTSSQCSMTHAEYLAYKAQAS